VEKIKRGLYVQKHFTENRAIYEIMWKNMAELEITEMTI
jgi:hypothetical protein